MNREDVIRWMQEVGAKESNPTPQTYQGFVDIFQHFAALVAAHEREACATVCDAKAERNFPWSSENANKYHAQADWANVCAEAIRARGEVPR